MEVVEGLLLPKRLEIKQLRPYLEADVFLMGIHKDVVLDIHGGAVFGVIVSQVELFFYLIIEDIGVMSRCC